MTKEVQKVLMPKVGMKAARRAHLRPRPKDLQRALKLLRVAAAAQVAVDQIPTLTKVLCFIF